MAIWGLQDVPNRNSVTGTSRKNRIDSKTTDSTMPRVVRMATLAATIISTITSRSTALRARCWG
jgi:hypothetical protein